jgi:O-antigen ligase
LLLSLSRTEWVAYAFGFLFFVSRGSREFRKKALFAIAVAAVVSVPLFSVGPIQEIITQRLGSFQHLSQDDSMQTRSAMYDRLLGDILRDPFGQGVSNAAVYDGYALDSGSLRLLLRLGMIGSLFYLAGICQIASRLLTKTLPRNNIQVVCSAIMLASLLKFFSVAVFENAGGAVLWLCMGLGLAARRFYGERVEETGMPERYAYAE